MKISLKLPPDFRQKKTSGLIAVNLHEPTDKKHS